MDPIPTPGSYRGTFREALYTTPSQYAASQERDQVREAWERQVDFLTEEAEALCERLRQAARGWMTPAEKRKAGKRQAPEAAYRAAVRGLHRSHIRYAVADGRLLPTRVLDEYPELA